MRTGPCTAGDRAVVAMDDGDARPPRGARRIVVRRPRQASQAQTASAAFMIERIARSHGGTIQLAAAPESLVIGAMLRV